MKGLAHTLCVALLVAVTLVACRRDDGEATLTLTDESFDGGKMSVAGVAATWTQGDEVWVNGSVYTIGVGNNGQASTTVVSAATYNALFPASVAVNSSTVRLPKDYQYATDGQGRQMLDLPMMASSDGTTLFFRHITAALVVSVANHRSETLTLDRVTVRSNSYAISGERSIDFADYGQSPIVAATADDKEVNIYFDRQGVVLNSGDSICVMLPVAPVGADNQFTVEVSTHREGYRYLATRTQENGHSFARNALGYAFMKVEGSLSGMELFDRGRINTASEFLLMKEAIESGWVNGTAYSQKSFFINKDIDMSGYEISPITGFSGQNFNGQDHTISNLTINSTGVCCALFDTIKSGTTISNITLANVTLNSNGAASERKISPLIGHLSSSNTIDNCHINGIEIAINGNPPGNIYFGGITATTGTVTTISNCSFNGNVSISSNSALYYGGLIGAVVLDNINEMNISSCSVCNNEIILNAYAAINAGGLAGETKKYRNTIMDCSCQINMSISNSTGRIRAGGYIGYLGASSGLLFRNTNTISGEISVGNHSSSISYFGTVYGKGQTYSLSNTYTANIILPEPSSTVMVNDPGN